MKHVVISLSLAPAMVVAPVAGQSLDVSTVTPDLAFPEPKPDSATQNASGINK